jgi:hypothetical protein
LVLWSDECQSDTRDALAGSLKPVSFEKIITDARVYANSGRVNSDVIGTYGGDLDISTNAQGHLGNAGDLSQPWHSCCHCMWSFRAWRCVAARPVFAETQPSPGFS